MSHEGRDLGRDFGRDAGRDFDRGELLSLLSASSTLAGLCITVIAFMSALDRSRTIRTVVDDLFALCAAGFLLCTCLIFVALRVHAVRWRARLARGVDALFLLALGTMTVAGFIMVYTIW